MIDKNITVKIVEVKVFVNTNELDNIVWIVAEQVYANIANAEVVV